MSAGSGLQSIRQEMDSEHKVQIGLIRAAEKSLAEDETVAETATILDHLVQYTNIHFLSEQLLMRLSAYPDLEPHESEHDQLMAEIRELAVASPGAGLPTAATLDQVRRRLTDHIGTQDQAFARYLGETATIR